MKRINSKKRSHMKKRTTGKVSAADRAREVLRIEADGIMKMIKRIDNNFNKVVEMLYRCQGRVVVTGIGKTGIIGRKISATFASTGTPSLWLHPVEAAHGDMGMVVKNDVIMAISSSGETEELVRLVRVLKKIGARLIVLTGNTSSTLARCADMCIDISVPREACTLGLVPTASTTAALAMGDALAVSLLEKKGFRLKDYAVYHPAGSIGRKLLQVKDLMRSGRQHAVVKQTALVKDVLLAITRARAGSATVIDRRGMICGIFTDGDLRRHLEKDPMITTKSVNEVMTHKPLTVSMNMLALEVLRLIKEKKVDEFLVVDNKRRLVGVIDEKDLLGIG